MTGEMTVSVSTAAAMLDTHADMKKQMSSTAMTNVLGRLNHELWRTFIAIMTSTPYLLHACEMQKPAMTSGSDDGNSAR